MKLRGKIIQRWWPTTQALDLVQGSIEEVANAVLAEVTRFIGRESLSASWESFHSLDEALSTAVEFTNVPTHFLVLPTRSNWTVIWNNSFLCNGYDSLCHCITKKHSLRTLHWSAHDDWTTFQSGAQFIHRLPLEASMQVRSVQVAQTDNHWDFYASGPQLPEEDTEGYSVRRKRDRLNEQRIHDLLERLGASPWSDEFYAFPEGRTFVINRTRYPSTVSRRSVEQVLHMTEPKERP
jgi:hypothetical protein